MSIKEKLSKSTKPNLEMNKDYKKEKNSFRKVIETILFLSLIASIGGTIYFTDTKLYKNFREHTPKFYIFDLYLDTNIVDLDIDFSFKQMRYKNGCSLDAGLGDNLLTFMVGCYENYIFFHANAKNSSNLVSEESDVPFNDIDLKR